MTRSGPFSGLRVIDLSRLLPGAYCTLLFADLGAEVIKVEEPGTGDYMRWMEPYSDEYSALFSATCRNKRSITLNLKTDEAKTALRDLARDADVLVESFRPGVAKRLGAGYEQLREHNPGLIYCSVSGYGQRSPRAARPGHDLNYLAVTGILDMTGTAEGPPIEPGVQMADVWGGGVTAAMAIMMALYERERTGEGRYLDVAMFDGVTAGLVNYAPQWFAGAQAFARGNMPLTGRHPNYGVYDTSNGYVSVANYEEKFWTALCAALGVEELSDLAFATGEEAAKTRKRLAEVFSTRSRDEWAELLQDVDTCVEPVLTMQEALQSDDFRERELVVEVDLGDGREQQLATPLTRYGRGEHDRAPRLGEHNDDILGRRRQAGDQSPLRDAT